MLHDRNTIHVPSHVIPAQAEEILGLKHGTLARKIKKGEVYCEEWYGYPYIPMGEVVRLLGEREGDADDSYNHGTREPSLHGEGKSA